MEIIENLITDLNELNEREFEAEQEKLEWLEDLLKYYSRLVKEDIEEYNKEKPDCDVDKIIEEQKIREHFE